MPTQIVIVGAAVVYALIGFITAAKLWDPVGETLGPCGLRRKDPEPKWMFWFYFITWPMCLFLGMFMYILEDLLHDTF